MRARLSGLSLQKKMLYSFGLLFMVSFTALLIFLIRSYRRERSAELQQMEEYNGQLNLSLEEILASTDAFRYLHFSDDKIRNLLCGDDSDIDLEGHVETETRLKEELSLLADMGHYVLRASIVTADGRIYKNTEEENSDYITRMNQLTEGISWKKGKAAYFSDVRRETISLVGYRVISMVSPVWNIIQEQPVAFLYLDLDFNKIVNQWYESAEVSNSFDFMIVNENQVLFDSQSGALPQDSRLEKAGKNLETQLGEALKEKKEERVLHIRGEKCVVAVLQNLATGWYLIQYMPSSNLMERILSSMSVFWAVLAMVIFLTMIGSYVLAKGVSRPVRELSAVMGQVANTSGENREIALYPQEEAAGEDEIGQMIQSYNAMAKRINDNIIKDYIQKLNQKQTELKMLQFQINPHFLYNALNTISSIAQLQDVDYIPEISASLSEMFRYNINGRELVTLQEELTQTENYMCIQKIRFPQRFVMETEVEEKLKNCEVLKFILQPIVENAYKYGFAKKQKKDILRIRGYRDGEEDMLLVVEDNGVGIQEEKLRLLNQALQEEDSFGQAVGIGLRNVNSRLKNYYGETYGVQVESEPGSFTRVYLRLKYVSRAEED